MAGGRPAREVNPLGALSPDAGSWGTSRVGAGLGAQVLGEPWEGRDRQGSVAAVSLALMQHTEGVCL